MYRNEIPNSESKFAQCVQDGRPLVDLITHRFALDQAVEAFQEFDRGETGKRVFVM